MSTKATYKIYDEESKIYVYFFMQNSSFIFNIVDMREHQKETGLSSAKAFIAINPKAIFTKGHNYHSDTDYQYEVKHNYVKVYEVIEKIYDTQGNHTKNKRKLKERVAIFKETRGLN